MSYYILECYFENTGTQKWFVKENMSGDIVWTSDFTKAKKFKSIDKVCSYYKRDFQLFPYDRNKVIIARRCSKDRPIEGYSVLDEFRKRGWKTVRPSDKMVWMEQNCYYSTLGNLFRYTPLGLYV